VRIVANSLCGVTDHVSLSAFLRDAATDCGGKTSQVLAGLEHQPVTHEAHAAGENMCSREPLHDGNRRDLDQGPLVGQAAHLDHRRCRWLFREVLAAYRMDLWESGHIARIDIDTDHELSRRAIDRIFAASGAHAIYESSDLQRVHRGELPD
jgi:hypothetical protein